jgi:hypothetical protein
LSEGVQNRVFLCNDVKPSTVIEFIDDQSIVPLNREIEPTVLPIVPQPRFWPSIMVSAAETENKKQRTDKHTNQPNARQTRVYGKEKKKSDSNSEKTEAESGNDFTTQNKLDCKYR